MQFFEASAGGGNTFIVAGPVSGLVLNIQYDASTAEGMGILGMGDVQVRVTGDLQMTLVTATIASPVLSTGGPVPVFPTTFFSLGGGAFTGEGPGSVFLGGNPQAIWGFADITISGTSGDVLLVSGGYSDVESFGTRPVDPFTLASVTQAVPEPGAMLLLGMGLGGVAFLRRRSR